MIQRKERTSATTAASLVTSPESALREERERRMSATTVMKWDTWQGIAPTSEKMGDTICHYLNKF